MTFHIRTLISTKKWLKFAQRGHVSRRLCTVVFSEWLETNHHLVVCPVSAADAAERRAEPGGEDDNGLQRSSASLQSTGRKWSGSRGWGKGRGGRADLALATAGNEDQILERQKAIQSADRLNRISKQLTLALEDSAVNAIFREKASDK